jgi:hypothetical protein
LALLGNVCQIDADCAFPYLCTNGKCAEQLNCTTTADCRGVLSSCNNGTPTKCVIELTKPCIENQQCDNVGGIRAVCDNNATLNPGTLTNECKEYGAEICVTTTPTTCLSNLCAAPFCHASADCVADACGCLSDAQCAPGQKLKYCNLSGKPVNACVECRTDADCTDPTNPKCDIQLFSRRCTHSCTTNADCTDTALPVCATGLKYCVGS